MKVSVMSTVEHDKIMSITSHLPHLIAFTIVGTAFNLNIEKNEHNFSAEDLKISLGQVPQIPKCGRIFLLKIKNIY